MRQNNQESWRCSLMDAVSILIETSGTRPSDKKNIELALSKIRSVYRGMSRRDVRTLVVAARSAAEKGST